MSAKSSIGKRFFRTGLYLIFLFLIQETVVRLCFPLPEIANLDRMIYEDPNNPEAPFLRNLTRTWQSNIDTAAVFEHQMNRYGFRGEAWPTLGKSAQQRVLFIGDSFVEGVMANDAETIPQGWLEAAGPDGYEVLNAGMVGRGMTTYLQATADLLPLYQPDVVYICIYANDLGQKEPSLPQSTLEPEPYSWYVPRFYELIRQRGLHGSVPPTWDNTIRSYFPTVPQPSNPLTKNAEVIRPLVSPQLFKDMEEGRFNPYRTNSYYKEELYLKQVPKLGKAISFLQATCTQNQARPVVVYLPSRHQVTRYYAQYDLALCQQDCSDSWDLTGPAYQLHQRILADQCHQSGVEFLDLTGFVRAKEAAGNHLYWNYDEHMRGRGYLQVGAEIARRTLTSSPSGAE